MTALAYCLLDAAGDVVVRHHATDPFYAASTIKLAVMAAAARAVDVGELAWGETIIARRVFHSAVPGAGEFTMPPGDRDGRLPATGSPMTARDVVRAMIGRSSNEATDMLVDRLGLPAVAAALGDAGIDDCAMGRRIGDAAAAAAGATNTVSAGGLARLMHAIVTGALASPDATAVMRDCLQRQEHPCIAEVLPPGARWGSKSGWVDGIEHDVAFVGDPESTGLKVLAVCTSGFLGRTGRREIRRVARALLAVGG